MGDDAISHRLLRMVAVFATESATRMSTNCRRLSSFTVPFGSIHVSVYFLSALTNP